MESQSAPRAWSDARYAHVRDQDLRRALQFLERHRESLEEGSALAEVYLEESRAVRRQLASRMIRRLLVKPNPATHQQRSALQEISARYDLGPDEIAYLAGTISRGRTEQFENLSETEAFLLLVRFGEFA